MDALLSSDQAGQLGLLQAITSDKENQKRIAAILEAQEAALAKLAEAQAQEAKNQQILAEARAERADAEQKMRLADEHERQLKEWEARIGSVSDSLNQEKTTWEAMRQRVDAELKDRDAALVESESRANETREFLEQSLALARTKAEAAEKMREDYHARHARLLTALALNEDA